MLITGFTPPVEERGRVAPTDITEPLAVFVMVKFG